MTVRPVVSSAEATAAASRVEGLLDGPRRVRFRDADATLTRQRLRLLVRTEPEDGGLAVSLDPKGLGASLRVKLGRFEVAPRDATFAVGAAGVRVVPSQPGRTLDVARIGRSLVSDLASTVHLARFASTPPALTTEDAEKLGIRERVSEFTTYYSCCQPRVTNIQRAAQMLDGTIVEPGESFSLNDALGKRTVERGFVSAPQIFDGRLEDAVGGGVSQVATTLYNAAFFAGVKLVAHQAHQFYISRYPMGREATVSWGGPELIFRNDWPAAILVKVVATDSSITVRFYSRKLGRRVETTTGEPYAFTPPETIRTLNSALPPGTTSTVQSAGESGFTVQYTRKVYRGSKLRRNEHFTVRYDPQNAIVEVGPAPRRTAPKAKAEADDLARTRRRGALELDQGVRRVVVDLQRRVRDVELRLQPALDLPSQAVAILPAADEDVGGERVETRRDPPHVQVVDARHPGTETIACATASASIPDGVCFHQDRGRVAEHAPGARDDQQRDPDRDDRVDERPAGRHDHHAPRRGRPPEPSRSAITCRSAASTFRLSPSERRRITAEIPFTARPASATTSIQPPRISGGSRNR